MAVRTLVAFGAIYLIWGSTYLAIAYAIESIPPLLMMGVRSLLAGGILYGWARLSGAAAPTRAAWRTALVSGAFLFLGSHGLLAWSEQRVPSGLAALIIATGTFWMIGVEWARRGGQRPTAHSVGGALLGLVGVVVLVGTGSGAVDPVGAGALVLSALLWAIGSVYARSANVPHSPQLATAQPLLTGGALLVLASVVSGDAARLEMSALDARALLALAYLVVFGSVLAFSAYIWLLRQTSAVRVSTHNFVNPIVAVLLGWLIAGESVTARTLLSGLIIIASIVLIHRARASTATARAPRAVRPHVRGLRTAWRGVQAQRMMSRATTDSANVAA